jgi:hypothetical protein
MLTDTRDKVFVRFMIKLLAGLICSSENVCVSGLQHDASRGAGASGASSYSVERARALTALNAHAVALDVAELFDDELWIARDAIQVVSGG